MTCPSSTENGCRCVEHHPGLGYAPPVDDRTVVLEVVTVGSRKPSTDDILDLLTKHARKNCKACRGNADRCQAGTGAPRFKRLHGCKAWASNGEFAALQAAPAPRQPWDVRPSKAV
jgi:hypothetical protein